MPNAQCLMPNAQCPGVGKTFHDDAIMSPPDYDAPLSWSPECGDYFVAPRDACPPGIVLCSVPGYKPADYEDSRVVRHAAGLMAKLAAARRTFFIAVGLRRPHLPWAVPEATARRVPPAKAIAIARHPTAARGAPAIAYFNCLNEGKCVRALLAPGPGLQPYSRTIGLTLTPNLNQSDADDAHAAR